MGTKALQDLVDKIDQDIWPEENPWQPPDPETAIEKPADYQQALERSKTLIRHAMAQAPGTSVIAFSGGTDSLVLVNIIYNLGYEGAGFETPPLIFCDTGMEYPETRPFVEEVSRRYQAELIIAQPKRGPLEQWEARGWPFLGKLPARKWMQKHRGRNFGFRLDVTSCCYHMKIAPVRRLLKAQGYRLKFAGTRGAQDDLLRSMRAHKDGAIYRERQSGTFQCNPLIGWTDEMVLAYTADQELPRHPLKQRGIKTTGCMYCGGGCQFDNSGYRILRHINPEAWRRFFVEWKAGEVLLAIKHDRPLWLARKAIQELGGLEHLAETRPWLFDFCRLRPLKGYVR